jgi:hypothetical protein
VVVVVLLLVGDRSTEKEDVRLRLVAHVVNPTLENKLIKISIITIFLNLDIQLTNFEINLL